MLWLCAGLAAQINQRSKLNKSPAFQFYPDKALAGTLHLAPVAFRAYWRIVWWMWLHSADHCSIPNEKNAVCTASGLTPRQYENVWSKEIMPEYLPMFKVEDNRLVCNGLRKEAEKQAARSESCRRSALAKRTLSERTATATELVCSPSPSSSPSPTPTPATPEEDTSLRKESKNKRGALETHGEFGRVRLSAAEHAKLLEKHGEDRTAQAIETLDAWLESTGKRRKNHYACLKEGSWVWEKVDGGGGGQATKQRFYK
jgi:hypothetical protein